MVRTKKGELVEATSKSSRRIIRRRVVEQKTGLGRSAIYQGIADGSFPKQVPLSSKAVGWIEAEIDAWIDARIARRDHVA